MATRPYKGKFHTTCPRCPFDRIYNTRNQGKRAQRTHSCERQQAIADRRERAAARREREGVKRDCQCKRANHQHGTRTAYVVDKCRCRPCTDASTRSENERNRLKAYGRYDTGRVDATPVRNHVRTLMANGIGLKRITILTGINGGTLGKLVYGIPSRNIPPRTRVEHATAAKILAIQPTPPALADGATVPAAGTLRRVQALVCLGYSLSHIGNRLGWARGNFHKLLEREQVTVKTARAARELFEELWDQPYLPDGRAERVAASRARNYAAAHGWAPPMAWDDDTIDNPKARPHGVARDQEQELEGAAA